MSSGVVVVCLNESQEQTTATAFSTQSCDNIANRNTSLDYFVFVLPAAGDAGRVFTTPSPTVFFDSGQVTGTIGKDAKFFYASAAPGTTLEEAIAHADNGSNAPTGGEDQSFNLTHTCPATTTSTTPSTTSSPSTTTSTTTTGGVSSTATSRSSTTSTATTTTGGVSALTTSRSTTTAVTGAVSALTTSATTATGSVKAVSIPNTGGGAPLGAGFGLLLAGGALITGSEALARRRNR